MNHRREAGIPVLQPADHDPSAIGGEKDLGGVKVNAIVNGLIALLNKWQDNVKEFNDRVVLVLINNVNDYLTGIGIDMGLDENVVWNVNGGQVNYERNGL